MILNFYEETDKPAHVIKVLKRIYNETNKIDDEFDFKTVLLGGIRDPTLYNVMFILTNAGNENFKATFKEFPPYGFYIDSIGGLYENVNKSLFWMIYEKTNDGEIKLEQGM
jgi:hypothetical protein